MARVYAWPLVAVVLAFAPACGSTDEEEATAAAQQPAAGSPEANRANLQRLELAMSKADMLGVMGPPEHTEAFVTTDGEQVEALFYVTENTSSAFWRRMRGENRVTDPTPVVLLNGKVVGWGTSVWEREKPMQVEVDVR